MNEQEVLAVLEKVGAVIRDSHIVYTSGKHGAAYVNKDAIYPYTVVTSRLCAEIAERFTNDNVEVVIAPAIGGVILSQWTAWHLTGLRTRRVVMSLYAEKSESMDSFVIRRGYDKLVVGKRILVVEDVLTTGGSVKKVVDAARSAGGEVVGIGVICNRGGITAGDVDVPRLIALVNMMLDSWAEAECPMCKAGMPIRTDVGHGKKFLEQRGKPH